MREEDSVARKKIEFQSRGIIISSELITELETNWNATAVRTGRVVLCLESPRKNGELIPAFIVNGKHVSKSPYHLVKEGSGFEIWKGDTKYTDIVLLPRPKFYDSFTSGKIPMNKLAVIVGPKHMRSVVNQRCSYHEMGKPCKFCAVQYWWGSNIKKAPAQIAETVEAGVLEGMVDHISLTTATTLNTKGKGLEGLVETAKLISAKVDIPIMMEFEPIKDLSLLEKLLRDAQKANVTTVSCNIECFDENLREDIMPIKGRIPITTYVKTWEKCLEIFGQNEVYTSVVVGIGEDDDSIAKGVKMAASHKVITFLVPHSPAKGAVFQDMEPPTPQRMLSVYKGACLIYKEFGLDLWASSAGCARGGGFSSIKEVGKFGM